MQRQKLNLPVYARSNETIPYPKGGFKGAYFETYHDYDVLWFVWDKDGIIPESIIVDDWEPIVLHWEDGDLIGVSVRRHYRWKDYCAEHLGLKDRSSFSEPLEVIFLGSNHGAYVRTPGDDEFEAEKAKHARLSFQLRDISKSEVLSYARKPHIGVREHILLSLGKDVYERADDFEC